MAYSTNRLLDQFYMSALHPSFTQDDGDRRDDDGHRHYNNNNSMPPAASRSSHSAAAALLYAGGGGSTNDAHANRTQLYGQSYSTSSSLPRSHHHQPHAQYRDNEQEDDERGRGAWGRHYRSEGPNNDTTNNNNSARRHRRRSSLAMSGGDDEGQSLDDEDEDGVEGGEQPTSLLTEYRGNRHQEHDDRSNRQRQQAMSQGGRPDSHTSNNNNNNNNNNRFHHRPPQQQQQHQQRTTAAAVELPTAAADYGAAVSDEVFALEAQLQRRREAEAARDCSPEEAAQSAFYLKNKRWKDAVQQRNERLKRELDETAEQELRFTPTVNHNHPPHRSPGRTASGGTGSMMTTTTRRQASGSSPHRSAAAPGWYHRNADDNDYDYDDEVEENEYDRHHQHHQDPLEVVDRLLQYQQSAKEKHEALRRAKAKEELKGCTFRPRTVKNALSETIQPRYLDAPPSGSDRNSARRKRAADGNDDDHLTPSFHPVVNPWVPGGGGEGGGGSKMEGYLSLPVHERLHKEAQSLAERRDRVEKLRTAAGTKRKSPSSSSVARSRSDGGPIQYTQTASVYDPMTSANWGDETALSPLGASTEGGDSPSVGRRVVLRGPLTVARAPTTDGRGSTTTTPNRSRRPHNDGGQPSQQQQKQEQAIRDKLAAYEEERQKRFQELEKSVREGLTFQPSICRGPKKLSVAAAVSSSASVSATAAAAAASVSPPRTSPRITKMAKETRRSLQDLQSFQHLTETKVQRLREERLREEDELMTDRPFITKYAAHAQGKVLPGTTGSIEDYRRFVAMEQRVRQRDLEAAMEAKESQAAAELQECTFHPTIHDAPSFVRDIAKEIRKVDGGVAARKRREAAKVVPPRRETVPW